MGPKRASAAAAGGESGEVLLGREVGVKGSHFGMKGSGGRKSYKGKVISVEEGEPFPYTIIYDDGEKETMTEDEIQKCLIPVNGAKRKRAGGEEVNAAAAATEAAKLLGRELTSHAGLEGKVAALAFTVEYTDGSREFYNKDEVLDRLAVQEPSGEELGNPKKARGRPPKAAAPPAATPNPPTRGPGRPPKAASPAPAKSPATSSLTPAKRGSERPPAVSPAAASPAPAKRGRPPKAPAKRGRPPKDPSAAKKPKKSPPPKRGPGRPKKSISGAAALAKAAAAKRKKTVPPAPADAEEEEELFEVQAIINMRKRGRRTEYLVKWKGYDDSENTWEPEKNLLPGGRELVEAFSKASSVFKGR